MTTPRSTDAQAHFHRIAREFDDLYEAERRSALRRRLDAWLRASIYRRYELTFEQLGDLHGKRVLDIGCGGGRYSVTAHQLGAGYVLGVDFAPNMIALAEQLAERSGADRDRLDFACDDFMRMEFDEPFDCAIGMGLFDYVEDPADFLRRIKAVVRGRIVASFPVKWSVWTPQRLLRYRLLKNCPVYFYTRERLEALFREVGFRDHGILDAHRDYFAVLDT